MTASLASWWAQLGASPKGDFLVSPSRTLSRGDLASLVGRFCAGFGEAGLRPGDRVLILMPDEGVAIAGFIAAMLDGLVPVMLTPETSPARAAAVASAVEPGAALVAEARADEAWLRGIPRTFRFTEPGPARAWFARRPGLVEQIASGLGLGQATRAPHLPPDPEGLAYILFTSGTTSSPSGVMIKRRNLLANVATIARVLGVDGKARVFNDMVLAHGDGLVQGPMMALGTGCALIRAGGFAVDRIEDWLDTVRREGATHVITVPTVWAMIDRYAQHSDYFAAPDFRGLSSVAAYLDPTLWDRLERRFGHPITNQYGLTETVASALYAGSHPETGARHTVGRPIDCEARVVPIGEGDAGELQLRGDNIFAGYWGDKDRTSRTLVEDGWMRTGDLARKRDDGSYEIVGRLKTVIMSGGFLIRPEEIDEAMRSHPGVRGAVTVGVEDPLFGEVPVSLVEVEGDLGEVELVAHARQALEPLKVPKRIVVAEAIPRGDAGKPRLDAVRALIAERLSEEPSTRAEGRDLEAAVIETAARVFRLEPSVLSLRSAPETVPGWDSFTQIALILALEERFGLRIPTSRAAAIRSLASALEAVQGSARKT